MKSEENTGKALVVSILSLSLLTVMAGAAVAPALGVIREYFADSSPVLVQMIISVPAIFIVITNAVFPKLCQKFGAKTLTMIGLLFVVLKKLCGRFAKFLAPILFLAGYLLLTFVGGWCASGLPAQPYANSSSP